MARSERMSAEVSELYERFFPRLVGQVYLVTLDMPAAEDAAQEAFAQLWARREDLSGTRSREAWLYRVAVNSAISRWRRLRRITLVAPPETALAELSEDTHHLTQALKAIPLKHRRALVLHYYCDMSVEQVANQLRVPIGTVKSWLHRGRDQLLLQLEDGREERSR